MILILSLKAAQVGSCSLVHIRKYCSSTSADQNPHGSGNHLPIRHIFFPKPCSALGCPGIYLKTRQPQTQGQPLSEDCAFPTLPALRASQGNAQALGGTPGAHLCSFHYTPSKSESHWPWHCSCSSPVMTKNTFICTRKNSFQEIIFFFYNTKQVEEKRKESKDYEKKKN